MITAQVNAASARALYAALQRVAKFTGKEIGDLIQQASVWATQSAAKATPVAKRRRMWKVPALGKRGGKALRALAQASDTAQPHWARFAVEHWRAGGPFPVWFWRRDAATADRTPKGKGAARYAWWHGLRQATGYPTKDRPEGTRGQRLGAEYGQGQARRALGTLAGVTIINATPYIGAIAPEAATTAVAMTGRRIEGYYRRVTERRIEQEAKRQGVGK